MSCAANAFVGAPPRHPIIATYLKFALCNVQNAIYGSYVLLSTGPCVLGRAILHHDQTFGNETSSWPLHLPGYIHWRGEKSEAIVATKCPGCGEGQEWEEGNNYMTLWQEKKYYCEDSASIFQTLDRRERRQTKDYSTIYTNDALNKNPYLGWQPTISVPNASFSWRSCLRHMIS
jgi:hypothetical protein